MRIVQSGARRKGQGRGQEPVANTPEGSVDSGDVVRAFATWRFESELVEAEISRHEEAERAMLRRIGCPVDLPTIYAILAGERTAPWRLRTSQRDRRRALHAMYTLGLLANVRGYVSLGHENARMAVYYALVAGATSNTATSGRLSLGNMHTATGKATAARTRKGRRATDTNLAALVLSYRKSQPEHSDRTMAENLARRLGRKYNTVRDQIRRLKQNGLGTVGT